MHYEIVVLVKMYVETCRYTVNLHTIASIHFSLLFYGNNTYMYLLSQ